jgi:hypothetical protein
MTEVAFIEVHVSVADPPFEIDIGFTVRVAEGGSGDPFDPKLPQLTMPRLLAARIAAKIRFRPVPLIEGLP